MPPPFLVEFPAGAGVGEGVGGEGPGEGVGGEGVGGPEGERPDEQSPV
jgi:hypothetical protein